MLKSLYIHERGKVYRIIANLKRSIAALEAISPRTKKIEIELKEAKDLEERLLKASKDPAFIKNLIDNSLIDSMTKAVTFSNTQSQKGQKKRARNGLTPSKRKARNTRIRVDYEKSRLNSTAFALRCAKNCTYEKGNGKYLSASGIKKVLRNK